MRRVADSSHLGAKWLVTHHFTFSKSFHWRPSPPYHKGTHWLEGLSHVFSDFAQTFGGAFDDPSGRLDAPCDRDCCCVAGLLRSWQSIAVAHLNISAWLQGLAVNARSRREQAWPWVWWWVINSFCFKLKKCFLSSAIRPLVLNLSRQSCSWYMQVAPTEPDLEAQACVGGRKALEH